MVMVAVAPASAQPAVEDEESQEKLITPQQHSGGAVAALFFGFGSGQAIQGRWRERGWIFTVGDTLSVAAMVGGAMSMTGCLGQMQGGDTKCELAMGTAVTGLLAFSVLRIWQTADAIVVPPEHNRLVREAELEAAVPYISPSSDGVSAGVIMAF
jgi:hypothetical protein